MGLGDLPQMSTSMIAAFCVQSSSEPAASASLASLLAVFQSRDFLSTHATPAVATALLHGAICFRSDSILAVACCNAAAAVVDACSSSACSASGPRLWPAFSDGSTVAIAWCALHIFADSNAEAGYHSASSTCSALWKKLVQSGVVAGQAAALRAIAPRADGSPIPITQRLMLASDSLPLEGGVTGEQLASDPDSAIPWPVRHHLLWMIQVDSETLLQQLVPLWISRSSFRPLWILQCAVQSSGDSLRYLLLQAMRFRAHLVQAVGYCSVSFVARQKHGAPRGRSLRVLRAAIFGHGRRRASCRKS